ncbi:hypothetical protein [Streptomyces sp. NPDC059468]
MSAAPAASWCGTPPVSPVAVIRESPVTAAGWADGVRMIRTGYRVQ